MNNIFSIADLKQCARRKLPKFVFDYIEEGCNANQAVRTNRDALNSVFLSPKYTQPGVTPTGETRLLDNTYALPFAIAPIGLSGLIWPKASIHHAKAAKKANIPFILSTVSTTSIETVSEIVGDNFWFQLYPPHDKTIAQDLLKRASNVGCKHLVVTMDVPSPGRRIKSMRNGLSVPPKISAANVYQSILRPTWALATVLNGLPQFANMTPYMTDDIKNMSQVADFIRTSMRDVVDLETLRWVRKHWSGKLIVKGVLTVDDALAVKNIGADAIVVSNHGGRQLDAAPSTVIQLPKIVAALNADKSNACEVMADSGVESGVDVSRFLALGAKMVLVGRAYAYGVGAGAQMGAERTTTILQEELMQLMSQLHCAKVNQLPDFLLTKQK